MLSLLLYPLSSAYRPFIPNEPPPGLLLLRRRRRHFPFSSNSKCSATTSATFSSPLKRVNTLSFSFARYGFSVAQTKTIMRRNPWFLSAEPERTIEPKLDYLLAFGFSSEELVQLIVRDPNLLCTSLASRISPNLSLLERLLGSKSIVMKACKRAPWLIRRDIEKVVVPVISELKAFGIPDKRIVQIFLNYPLVVSQPVCVVTEGLSKLKSLGMNPDTMTFINGLAAMVTMKKTTWDRKMQLYMSFGWSEEDVLLAFARQSTCMMISDEKIKKMMGFFKDTLNWDSIMMVKRVALLTVSLENRILPRCAVMELLGKKGLWKGMPSLYTLLCISEKQFEERFVENYKEKVPGLYDAYLGMTEFSGFSQLF